MKGGLFRKLSIMFLFLISVLFFLVNFIGAHHINRVQLEQKEKEMYREADILAQKYIEPYYDGRIELTEIMNSLRQAAKLINYRILLVSPTGRIIGDTAPQSANKVQIDKKLFAKAFHKNVILPGVSTKPQLLTLYPTSYEYGLCGYVCLLMDAEEIQKDTDLLVNELNLYYLIITGLIFLIFVAIYILFVIPTRRLIKVTNAYSEGNFEKKIVIKSNDEYRVLFERIGYMGETMSRFDEYQRKIISNISHDFRSPLTSIKGYTEAIKDGTILPDQQGKYLDTVLFEVERLTKLTTNLLTLNTFDQKGMLLQKSKFDINAVIKDVARSFEGTCKKKHLTIQMIFAEPEITVFADRGKIEQVIYNLVDNAIKFSHAEGEICLFTEKKGHKAMVSVQDEGVGIEKRDLAKIWDRFYKTDTSRGKDKKGTGLGLSIVKEIMTAHGENINVISTTGVGTEFILTLPLAEPGNAGES